MRGITTILLAGIIASSLFAAAPVKLLNVSCDPTRELYQDFNSAFANAFVYGFLGDVTVFDGSFVRPHNVAISPIAGSDPTAAAATVRFIGAAAGVVRVELRREDTGATIEAEITRERCRELGLRVGDYVRITPRHARVFAA